jgi:hypothetical protein
LCGVKVYFYPLGRRFFTTTTTTTTTTRPLSLVFLSGLGIPCGFCVSADHVRPPRRIIRPMDNPNPAAAAIQQITFLLQLDCWCYYYDTTTSAGVLYTGPCRATGMDEPGHHASDPSLSP